MGIQQEDLKDKGFGDVPKPSQKSQQRKTVAEHSTSATALAAKAAKSAQALSTVTAQSDVALVHQATREGRQLGENLALAHTAGMLDQYAQVKLQNTLEIVSGMDAINQSSDAAVAEVLEAIEVYDPEGELGKLQALSDQLGGSTLSRFSLSGVV